MRKGTRMKKHHRINVTLAVSSLAMIVLAMLMPMNLAQQIIFLFGMGLLDVAAILERHTFFIVLQTISFVGTAMAFLALPMIYKAMVPILLTTAAIIYFIVTEQYKNTITLLGIIGLLGLAVGFAASSPIAYLVGGIFIMMYSYAHSRDGNILAIVFLTLNTIFTMTSALGVWQWFRSL
jgi:small-conductance mechanosensitive channel